MDLGYDKWFYNIDIHQKAWKMNGTMQKKLYITSKIRLDYRQKINL